jgi:hypothetical protein
MVDLVAQLDQPPVGPHPVLSHPASYPDTVIRVIMSSPLSNPRDHDLRIMITRGW